jgi:hypothetical protein
MSDDGSGGGDSSGSGGEDVAKRRSKNRVNARRSRERKRLMLDTLQQEHWQLHQENQRIKGENTKLHEAMNTIKSLRRKKAVSQPLSTATGSTRRPQGFQPPAVPTPTPANIAPSTGTPLLDMLMQQLQRNQAKQPNSDRQAPAPPPANAPQQADMLASLLLAKLLNNGAPQQAPVPAPAPPPPPPTLDNNAMLTAGLGALLAAVSGNQNNGGANTSAAGGLPSLLPLLQILGQQQGSAPQNGKPPASNGINSTTGGRPGLSNTNVTSSAQQLLSLAGGNGQRPQAAFPGSSNGQHAAFMGSSNDQHAAFNGINGQQTAFNNLGAGAASSSSSQQASFKNPAATTTSSSQLGQQPFNNGTKTVSSSSNSASSTMSAPHSAYGLRNDSAHRPQAPAPSLNNNGSAHRGHQPPPTAPPLNSTNIAALGGGNVAFGGGGGAKGGNPDLAALLQMLSQANRNPAAAPTHQPPSLPTKANSLAGQLSQLQQHQARMASVKPHTPSGEVSGGRKDNSHQ